MQISEQLFWKSYQCCANSSISYPGMGLLIAACGIDSELPVHRKPAGISLLCVKSDVKLTSHLLWTVGGPALESCQRHLWIWLSCSWKHRVLISMMLYFDDCVPSLPSVIIMWISLLDTFYLHVEDLNQRYLKQFKHYMCVYVYVDYSKITITNGFEKQCS